MNGPSLVVASPRVWAETWMEFWRDLSPLERYWPVIFVFTYWAVLQALHGFRSDHVSIGLVLLVLSYSGKKARAFLRVFWPFLATAVVYDSQRFYSDYIRGPIHVQEPYLFDKHFFGIQTSQGVLTPNEYFDIHRSKIVDLITGFAYLVFVAEYFLFMVSLYFVQKNPKLAARATVSFFILNVIGYSTYYWFAAAPPWYVAHYGLGPARLDVAASPAACIRFDEILGTHFFAGMYGRAADVFGAVPSLHVAYPLLAFFYSLYLRGRAAAFWIPFTAFFWALMVFSAVYLQHHYVLDILWGDAYAVLVFAVMEFYFWRSHRRDY